MTQIKIITLFPMCADSSMLAAVWCQYEWHCEPTRDPFALSYALV
jgi:hypothetical protein